MYNSVNVHSFTKVHGNKNRKRIIINYQEDISADSAYIFSLLCPSERYKWIPGWSCEMIYSDSGKAEENAIFSEMISGLFLFGDSDGKTTWYTSQRNDQEKKTTYIIMFDTHIAGRIDTSCIHDGGSSCTYKWVYSLTALTDKGESLMDDGIEEKAHNVISFIALCLKHFAETGTTIPA